MSVALQMGGAAWPSEEFGNSVEALEFGLEVMLGEGNVLRSWDTILYYDDKHDLVLGDILAPYSVASTAQWCCPYIRPTYRVTCNDEVMALVDIPLVIAKAIHKSADIDE